MEIGEMAEIEIKAMVNAGILEDIATGWVVKALEDLKVAKVLKKSQGELVQIIKDCGE